MNAIIIGLAFLTDSALLFDPRPQSFFQDIDFKSSLSCSGCQWKGGIVEKGEGFWSPVLRI